MHPSAASRRHRDDEDDEEDEDEEEDPPGRLNDAEYADGEGDPCPNCGRVYRCVCCLVRRVLPSTDHTGFTVGLGRVHRSGSGTDWSSAVGVV